MNLRAFRIPFYFFLFGMLWAITSDPVITFLSHKNGFEFVDSIRGMNDFIFVILGAVLLYLQIKQEQEKLVRAYRESRRMSEVIDKIANMVLIVNDEGYITWVNRAFTEFTGFTSGDTAGKRPHELLFGPRTDMKTVQKLKEALQQKHSFTGELINYKKNGEAYWTQLNISSIFDQDGKFEFFISVENIITERKQNEEQLIRQYQAFRSIAWAESHEIRKPLASILSLVELLKQSESYAEREELLEMMDNCAAELDAVIKVNSLKINEIERSVNPFSSNL